MIGGALGFLLANLLDECDGRVARLTQTSSRLGALLDAFTDWAVHSVFFLGLAVGIHRQLPHGPWLVLGGIAASGIFLSSLLDASGIASWQPPSHSPQTQGSKLAWIVEWFQVDFSILVLLSAFLQQMAWILWAGAVGVFLFWIPGTFFVAARWSQIKLSLRWVGLLVGAALFFWILGTQDLRAVWRQMQVLNWRFGWILLFYVVIFGLDTLGWRFALTRRSQAQVRWSSLFRTRLAGEAVNYVTPTGYIGGEPVKALLLSRRHGIPLADGMASVVVAKTTLVFSMLLFILAGIGVALATQRMEAAVFRWVWVVLPVLSLLLLLFLLAQFLQPFRRGSSLARGVSLWARLPRLSEWLKKATEKVHEWDHAILSFYRQSPGSVFWSLSFHFLGWLAGAVDVYLILHLLGIPVSLATAFSIEALWVLLRTAAFMIPASLGASEGILLLICGGLGVSAVPGLALGLLRRAREMIWVGLGLLEFGRADQG